MKSCGRTVNLNLCTIIYIYNISGQSDDPIRSDPNAFSARLSVDLALASGEAIVADNARDQAVADEEAAEPDCGPVAGLLNPSGMGHGIVPGAVPCAVGDLYLLDLGDLGK